MSNESMANNITDTPSDEAELSALNDKTRATINHLKMIIKTCREDYKLMIFQLENPTDHSVDACIERMRFRSGLFDRINEEPSECFYE